ncbi:MAG: prokaryotic cytochrome C oxidase subunit IV family protein [Robiginitomaculum sp.]|nr:MAG: prokaryotic cytochrome C oxidase subunit IV family protein [Robiginitomaculum sp.]
MISILKHKVTIVWLALMFLTCLSWALGANHSIVSDTIRVEVFILLGLAFFKIRLVMFYFMEVKKGPRVLKLSCDAWIIFTFVGLIYVLNGAS